MPRISFVSLAVGIDNMVCGAYGEPTFAACAVELAFHYSIRLKTWSKTRDFIHVFDKIMCECEQLTSLITDLVFDKLHLTRHVQTEAACHRLDLRPLNVFDCTGKWNLETSQMDQINRLPRAGFSLFLLTFVHKCDVIC